MPISKLSLFFAKLNPSFNRAVFYRALAGAYERKESLKLFLEGEIAVSARVGDKARRAILQAMLTQTTAEDNSTSLLQILTAHMPAADHLMLQPLSSILPDAIPSVLYMVADTVDMQAQVKAVVIGAVVIPILLIASCLFSIAMDSQLILGTAKATPPYVFNEVFQGGNALVLLMARYSTQFGLYFLAVFAALIAASFFMLSWRSKGLRRSLESWPIFSTYRDIESSKLLPALAVYLQAGVLLPNAVEKLAFGARPWMRSHLARASSVLKEPGVPSSEIFAHGMVSKPLMADILTLTRSKPLSDVIIEQATTQSSKIVSRVRVSANLSGILLAGLFVVFAIYLFISGFRVQTAFNLALNDPFSLANKERAWRENKSKPPVFNPSK
jgi:type II secretory pathway component PulF